MVIFWGLSIRTITVNSSYAIALPSGAGLSLLNRQGASTPGMSVVDRVAPDERRACAHYFAGFQAMLVVQIRPLGVLAPWRFLFKRESPAPVARGARFRQTKSPVVSVPVALTMSITRSAPDW